MNKTRKPILAFFLSLFSPGLGQLYNGQVGLAFLIPAGSVFMIFLTAAAYAYGIIDYYVLLFFIVTFAAIMTIGAAILSAVQAKRSSNYRLKRANHLIYYIAFSIGWGIFINGLGSLEHKLFTQSFRMANSSMSKSVPLNTCLLTRSSLVHTPQLGEIAVWSHNGYSYVSRITGAPDSETPVHLDHDHYYLQADESHHMDSTLLGPISKDEIKGTVRDIIKPTFGTADDSSFLDCVGKKIDSEKI